MAPPSHLFQGYRWCCAIMVYICVLPLSSNASKNQMVITIGDPGVVEIQAPLELKGVERFDSLQVKNYPKYETNFTTNLWKGVYHNVTITKAGWDGGAGGQGYFPYAIQDRPYKLEITPISQGRGPTYFGLWVSNSQPYDHLDFFYKKQPLSMITLKVMYDKIPSGGTNDGYWTNPYFAKNIRPHAYVFMNFYFQAPYDEVRFSAPRLKFFSDNHSIGHWKDIWGTRIHIGTHLKIIEPSTPETQLPSTPETQLPSTPETQLPSTPETQLPSTPETQPRSTPETQPSRPEPAPRKAEQSRPKVAPRTPAQADQFPTISTVWITIGVIIGRVALV